MPKPSHRDKLLQEGLAVVLAQGYTGASVRDIVRAAGVPQGSFTNHFTSKEAFAEEVLDLYFSMVRTNIDKTLRNDSLPPLRRLRAWLDVQIAFLRKEEFRRGCLIGNFSIEASEQSKSIRKRLTEMFKYIHESIVYCLKAAENAGELSAIDRHQRNRRLSLLFLAGSRSAIKSRAEHQAAGAIQERFVWPNSPLTRN